MAKTQKSKIVVANWKMNPESPEAARAIFLAIRRAAEKLKRTQAIVCTPAIFFAPLQKLAGKKVAIGLQNIFFESSGSYTGEISPEMLKAAGGTHVIVGHSERRSVNGAAETDEVVNKKVLAALRQELTVILCVGEKERDHTGSYLPFIKAQLGSALAGIQKRYVDNLIIAYEPVWAIGKSDKEAMRGAEMLEMNIYIKKVLAEMLGREYADVVPVLYGGSVSPLNAQDIVAGGQVSGLLVGRQSLDPIQFKQILEIVEAEAKKQS